MPPTAIAEALAAKPDVLLLDEPTNHLDVEGILWLEKLIESAPFASVFVTHDRYFLENASTRVAEINRAYPLGLFAALPLALVAGLAGMLAVALALRTFGRLEQDQTLSIDRAVGVTGVVYLSIPGERTGAGKVHLTVQQRLVELQAVTPQAALPTGAPVLVIDVAGPDTVVVVPNPLPDEVPDAVP